MDIPKNYSKIIERTKKIVYVKKKRKSFEIVCNYKARFNPLQP